MLKDKLTNAFKASLLRPQDWIGVILVVALLNGLIYAFMIPPWWHYDEPGHFEYAWMMMHKSLLPNPGHVDESFRRDLALSLDKYRYYEFLSHKLDLSSDRPVWIGMGQYVNLPLYYWYVSLPLRLIPNADYALQNYVIRLMTLGLLLATIWLAWKIMREITPEKHPLRWMIPAFLALVPGFVELMTSISDDAGAVFIFTLFIYFAIRQIMRGFRWQELLGLIISAGLCLITKNTVWISLPLLVMVALFIFLRGKLRPVAWGFIALAVITGLFMSTRWGDAANWAPVYGAENPTQMQSTQAVDGSHVLVYVPQNDKIAQIVPLTSMRPLRDKKVTIGVWMWAESPVEARFPLLIISGVGGPYDNPPAPNVALTTQPQFFTLTLDIPFDAGRSWLFMSPYPAPDPSLPRVFYDGVVMAQGQHSNTPPENLSVDGAILLWDGDNLPNLIRNGSAENAWFGSALEKNLGNVKLPIFNWSATLATIQDTQAMGTTVQNIFEQLLKTFWAQPAKNYVSLLGERKTYFVLYALTAAALIGVLISAWRKRKTLSWPAVFTLAICAAILWFQAFLRSSSELFNSSVYIIPFARYAAPAIVGSALIICAGWMEIFSWLKGLTPQAKALLYLGFLIGLNLFALLSVTNFFYFTNGEVFIALFLITILGSAFALYSLSDKFRV